MLVRKYPVGVFCLDSNPLVGTPRVLQAKANGEDVEEKDDVLDSDSEEQAMLTMHDVEGTSCCRFKLFRFLVENYLQSELTA
tara:strand:- start:1110 stop:1355 length:246 start_codon:yes stop_codon:yes gene_type:complete